MNNQERQALIEVCKQRVTALTNYCRINPEDSEAVLDLKLCQTALAALTTEPVKVPDEITMRDAIRLKLSVDWAAGYNTAIAHCKELSEPIDNTAQQYEALAKDK